MEILRSTMLRTDENDPRILPNLKRIGIPLKFNEPQSNPNWDNKFGAIAF